MIMQNLQFGTFISARNQNQLQHQKILGILKNSEEMSSNVVKFSNKSKLFIYYVGYHENIYLLWNIPNNFRSPKKGTPFHVKNCDWADMGSSYY